MEDQGYASTRYRPKTFSQDAAPEKCPQPLSAQLAEAQNTITKLEVEVDRLTHLNREMRESFKSRAIKRLQ